MKALSKSSLVLILLLFTLFAVTIPAQTTTDYFTSINKSQYGCGLQYAAVAIDSAETIYSEDFSVSAYDGFSFTTYPWAYGYDFATADSISISAYWVVSYDNVNWINADTLFTATSATAAKGTADLNNVKAPHNKIKIVNNAGSKANTLYLGLWQAVKD